MSDTPTIPTSRDDPHGVLFMLGRLEGKVDNILVYQEAATNRMDRIEDSHNEHGERLGNLERGNARRIGAVGASGGIIGAILTFLATYFGKHF